jgi:GlcNAc-P-P-Und epimerase
MTLNNILVTGGSGFIGTHLVQELLSHASVEKVYVLDIKPPSVQDERVVYLECDLRQPITEALPKNVTLCFHLAALAKDPGYEWDDYYRTNYLGTKHLCNFLEQNEIRQLVFTSTMMVFRAGDKRYRETDMVNADTAYGGSKALAEEVVATWQVKHQEHRLRVVRPGVVFGQGENGNYTRLYYALKKQRFAYIGRKTTIKSSIYVKDLAKLLLLLANDRSSHTTFHGVYPSPTSIEDICKAMADVFGFQQTIPVIPYQLALAASYPFEFLNTLGLKNSIHHRRIQKLYYSTNISAELLDSTGFVFDYPLREALLDWQKDCKGQDLW